MNHAALSVPSSSSRNFTYHLDIFTSQQQNYSNIKNGFQGDKTINLIKYRQGKRMIFFSDDIKTNNNEIYYADESSCKDKIDLIQIAFLP